MANSVLFFTNVFNGIKKTCCAWRVFVNFQFLSRTQTHIVTMNQAIRSYLTIVLQKGNNGFTTSFILPVHSVLSYSMNSLMILVIEQLLIRGFNRQEKGEACCAYKLNLNIFFWIGAQGKNPLKIAFLFMIQSNITIYIWISMCFLIPLSQWNTKYIIWNNCFTFTDFKIISHSHIQAQVKIILPTRKACKLKKIITSSWMEL